MTKKDKRTVSVQFRYPCHFELFQKIFHMGNIYAYFGTLLGQILHNMWLPVALKVNIANKTQCLCYIKGRNLFNKYY